MVSLLPVRELAAAKIRGRGPKVNFNHRAYRAFRSGQQVRPPGCPRYRQQRHGPEAVFHRLGRWGGWFKGGSFADEESFQVLPPNSAWRWWVLGWARAVRVVGAGRPGVWPRRFLHRPGREGGWQEFQWPSRNRALSPARYWKCGRSFQARPWDGWRSRWG